MKTILIALLAIVVVAAIAAYMFMGSGFELPSTTDTSTTPSTETIAAGEPTGSSDIDEAAAAATTDAADAAASDISEEIGSADSLEIPDVQ